MAVVEILGTLSLRTVLLCVFVFLVVRWFLAKPKNLPPGPWGLPFIGALATVARAVRRGVQPHELFMEYAAKYGPVFHLKILNKHVLFLNDYASVKEAFQNPQLNDRPAFAVADEIQSERKFDRCGN